MPQNRCGHPKKLEGRIYFCNRDKGHNGDHAYLGADEEPVVRWK